MLMTIFGLVFQLLHIFLKIHTLPQFDHGFTPISTLLMCQHSVYLSKSA